ncbi:MAG: site-specific integrase [Candidatus Bathyarchaeota archaeon]|nr:site-specific integrase [Candidatus Bathyarchaeota archaeon]
MLNVLIQMKKDNKSNYTINFTRKALGFLGKHTSLAEPEAVKLFIAELEASDGYKRNLCIAYNKYAKLYGIKWNMPIYRQPAKNISLPTREKIQMLIASAGQLLSMKLTLSMETGLRPIELTRLKVKDLDLEHRTVNPTTAKKGNARTIPMSQSLTQKLQEHIRKEHLTPNDLLFEGTDADHYGKQYRQMRNALAEKLKDASIRQIRFYDLRHYFCTKKLHDIGNPYTVMVLMGHTKLETTQRYMHLLNLNDDEWTVDGATTVEQAKKLLEAGFQYQTTIEGVQLFRKRK